MLSRLAPVARSVRASATGLQIIRSVATPHGSTVFKSDKEIAIENKATLNDLPIPKGSWQAHYDKRNARWHLLLALATGFFIVTVVALRETGCTYLHDAPPLEDRPRKY